MTTIQLKGYGLKVKVEVETQEDGVILATAPLGAITPAHLGKQMILRNPGRRFYCWREPNEYVFAYSRADGGPPPKRAIAEVAR